MTEKIFSKTELGNIELNIIYFSPSSIELHVLDNNSKIEGVARDYGLIPQCEVMLLHSPQTLQLEICKLFITLWGSLTYGHTEGKFIPPSRWPTRVNVGFHDTQSSHYQAFGWGMQIQIKSLVQDATIYWGYLVTPLKTIEGRRNSLFIYITWSTTFT